MDKDISFIEVQFPVSKVSKESYKERKAGQSQTLTGLGKWWGRKPLILVRAALLGAVMPVSQNFKKDKEIFLKILTMDEKGLLKRKNKSIPINIIFEKLTPIERKRYFSEDKKVIFQKGISQKDKQDVQKTVFNRMSYDEKLEYCLRPEEIDNIEKEEWHEINNHLNTNASNLQELINELGKLKFGENLKVGDCFCGGGSIPFEAARMGFNVYASDLSPVAALLTWAALNINGSGSEEVSKLKEFQQKIYDMADKIITDWGIEHNEKGWRANSYLYCNEVVCPECGWKAPLAPSWVIGKGTKTIAVLKENENKGFDIDIKSGVSDDEMKSVGENATIKNGSMVCPHCKKTTPITAIRKDRKSADGSSIYGLRKWESDEFIPRPDDVFQERLYCIRYEDENNKRHYVGPTKEDFARESKIIELLKERFSMWQEKGYIPSSKIEEGDKTDEPIRTRGWSYWHQLFNPRQLLTNGLLMELVDREVNSQKEKIVGLLSVNKGFYYNSKLCIWDHGSEKGQQTYYNQALNTLFHYVKRALPYNKKNILIELNLLDLNILNLNITTNEASQINDSCHLWVTDPPYGDAVNYHELSEFFLAWDKKMLPKIFPDWYTDSKRVLAVKGTGEEFITSMIKIYKNLATHMPDNGIQIVMFTHQDAKIWKELTLIMWSAGLRVTAAWCVATETESGGLKEGNYVKGTVLLILRKQTSDETAYMNDLLSDIEKEVIHQIDTMRDIDNNDDPNFSDADYLLAAYAASVKILTSYKNIEDIDILYEISKIGRKGETSPIEKLISQAVKIAYDYLIPPGFDKFMWKLLTPEERFYIKGLELEKNNNHMLSSYQELARGFGVKEYKDLLSSVKANSARLKSVTEFAMKQMSDNNFGKSLLRNILAAIYQVQKEENTQVGKTWLKSEVSDYWNKRKNIIEILGFLSSLEFIDHMQHWKKESVYARLLKELLINDGV